MSSSKTIKRGKVARHEWHALPVEAVYEALSTSSHGLTHNEVEKRKGIYGPNKFTEEDPNTLLERIFEQFKSPLTIVLFVASLATLALQHYVDASVIFFAMLIAVVLGVMQEGRASRAFEKLSHAQVKKAIVIRGGKRHEIFAEELVPGDLVVLQNGMKVPADVRIVEAKKLAINEAPLTGEWVAVKKHTEGVPVGTPFSDLSSVAHMGTFVAEGYGLGVVVAIGDETEVGRLAKDVGSIIDETTPIQIDMAHISHVMLVIVLALIVAIFLIGVARGVGLETMLLTSIAIAVAAIPEGLPAAVTIVLAVGMEALLRRGGLVRNLLAAETLGSTTYILTDKTGTLTEARMAITQVVYYGCVRDDENGLCEWKEDETARVLFDTALTATDSFLDESESGDEAYVVRGEPVERAILESAQELGITLSGDSGRGRRIDLLAFESENRFAAGLTQGEDGMLLCVNGAPELLLSKSTHVQTPKGVKTMSTEAKAFFEEEILTHTREGKRLIAVGFKNVEYTEIPENDDRLIDDMIFAGLLVIDDPVREDVKEAIKGVRGAGAEIRLVTGDNPETALSVAKAVGIARKHDIALTGDQLAELTDTELLEVLHETYVFARVLPRQKMRLAQILQASGEVVAMTGDGINDAPALRKANIGVAIGSGTEVAKEASDLVLVKDSFTTVYAAIEEGRRIIRNLRRIVGYLISTSLSETVLIGGALLTGAAIPILPAQILWANIIEEGLMSVAFAFEPGDKNAMKEKPRDVHEEGVLSKDILLFAGFVISVLSILLLSIYAYLRINNTPLEELRSVMFLAISIDSLFIAFSFRSLTIPLWNIPLRTNLFFLISFCISFTLLLIVISVPFLQSVFSYVPLTLFEYALVLGYGISCLVFIELGKWVFFRKKL